MTVPTKSGLTESGPTESGLTESGPTKSGARIVSVNTGGEKVAPWAGKMGRTAIDKRPVWSAVPVSALGLAGDEQADKLHHGGPDQAIYAYAREDLDWWADRLGRELRDGMFGENITTAGLDLNGAVIGETWRFGAVVVQVTSPRVPCVVFRNWMDEAGWIKAFREAGRPGAYLRVCQPGMLRAGDPIEPVSRPENSVTVAEVLEAYYRRDAGVIRRMTAVPGHSRGWEGVAEEWLAAEPAGTSAAG
jgi:MOSC domain-containing protein YiiM